MSVLDGLGVGHVRLACARLAQHEDEPVQLHEARRHAPRDDEAARLVSGWEQANAYRLRIVEVLEGVRPVVVQLEDGTDFVPEDDEALRHMRLAEDRMAVVALALKDGEVLETAGRLLRSDWLADPRATAEAMAGCSSSSFVGRTRRGKVQAVPRRCNSSVCPVCRRLAAAERSERWTPVIAALVARGMSAWSVTLTQPTVKTSAVPFYLDPAEVQSGRYVRQVDDAPSWRAVPGESLTLGLWRLRQAWDGLREASWWPRDVVGGLYGIEATGRDKLFNLRYHVHMHVIVVLRAETDPAEWWSKVLARWRTVTAAATFDEAHASDSAQHARPIEGGRVVDAVRECLKYPCKLSEMTTAQTLDWLAVTKGNHWGCPFGAFHGTSAVRRAARGLMALDAEQDSDFG